MTDAPRRIKIGNLGHVEWPEAFAEITTGDGLTGYVREDIHDALKSEARSDELDAIAAAGQAGEAQLKAEAERDRLRDALEFYADPFDKETSVPDFYSELSFEDTAIEALKGGKR